MGAVQSIIDNNVSPLISTEQFPPIHTQPHHDQVSEKEDHDQISEKEEVWKRLNWFQN